MASARANARAPNMLPYKESRARGGIGIRVRLRSVWSDPWGFKSPRAHLILEGFYRFQLIRWY